MWFQLPQFISRMDRSEAMVLLPAIWFGPTIIAALAASWLSGRRGDRFLRGAAMGSLVVVATVIFGCFVHPFIWLAPVAGAIAAIAAVLYSS